MVPPSASWPTMSPRGLIPKGWVDVAPGTSMVVKSPGHVEANDVTLRVDGAGPSSYGSRDYEVGNDALVDQEAIRKGSPDTVKAQDVTRRVDIT